MTQRSILAGTNQTIIIKVGGSVSVKGHDSDLVMAETRGSRWGLTLERRSESQIGRARAVVGEHVLFDVRMKMPNLKEKKADDEVIEVQMGGGGEVLVPFSSNVKIYAGKDIEAQGIKGRVDAYSGHNLNLQDVFCLGIVSAGGSMNVDCQTMIGNDVNFASGGDLRFHVVDLTSLRLRVKDLGGYWEARMGDAGKSVYLKSGGDVTFVTDQKVESLPPNHVLGKIEKPSVA
ncbi:MAG: hypothetical protein WCA79_14950 [Anaerolineales bacterium]